MTPKQEHDAKTAEFSSFGPVPYGALKLFERVLAALESERAASERLRETVRNRESAELAALAELDEARASLAEATRELGAAKALIDAFEHALMLTMSTVQFGWAGTRVGDCTTVKAATFARGIRQQAEQVVRASPPALAEYDAASTPPAAQPHDDGSNDVIGMLELEPMSDETIAAIFPALEEEPALREATGGETKACDARCSACGHFELNRERAVATYAHCPSCGVGTRGGNGWVRVPIMDAGEGGGREG